MRCRLLVKTSWSDVRARRASVPIRIVLFCLLIYANATFGAEDDFQKLYDYYFPKESQDVRASYRRYFDKLFFGPPPRESETKRASQVYYALRGDDAAFHAFLHNPDWAVNGAPGEECVYESVLLL
jgi:hypothetical protein